MNRSHSVFFYESEQRLVARLLDILGPALQAGEAAVVIARPALREELAAWLNRQPWAVGAWPRFTLIDAADAIATFLEPGQRPDPARFGKIIGGHVQSAAAAGNGQVRAYGEMVSLLWADGNPDGALEVEALWKDLSAHHCFSLLCGYPLDLFSGESAHRLREVCAAHDHVEGAPEDHAHGNGPIALTPA